MHHFQIKIGRAIRVFSSKKIPENLSKIKIVPDPLIFSLILHIKYLVLNINPGTILFYELNQFIHGMFRWD